MIGCSNKSSTSWKMDDIRLRIINFLVLSIAYSIAPLDLIPLIFVSALIFALIFRMSLRENILIVLTSSGAILIIAIIAWLISSRISVFEFSMNYLRWVSLIVISVIFFSLINLFEFVSALRFFKIPTRIAIAFGVGLRFLPVLIEESRKVVQIQQKNGLKFSITAIRQKGLFNLLNKLLSPLIVSILRRVDSISLSVVVQQIEFRIAHYRFKSINFKDWMILIFCIMILLLSIFYADILFYSAQIN